MRAPLALLLLACACRAAARSPARELPAESPGPPAGDEVIACGRRFHTGAPVVPWTAPPYYSTYSPFPRFHDPGDPGAARGLRYQPGRKTREGTMLVAAGDDDLDRLRAVVDQLVIHYDAAGTSRRCFEILQDLRGLSVHFLLDVDGTIYQTLDLRDQAWHATKSNPRSIGIEVASIGAYPPGQSKELDQGYARDESGPYVSQPEALRDSVRTKGFVARPARPERIRGRIQGVELEQLDFTPEQYDSLEGLAAALCRIFPRIAPDAPRDGEGRVKEAALPDDELASFHGILGHFHVQPEKQDPGPAFDWEGFLAAVRARLARAPPSP